MNRRRGSLASSPLLIGAVTTLIVVVAVFLSYNANNGLPFVPTYNIKVVLPEASGLQPANQVRIAGTRVGIVSSLSPHQDPATGRVTAIVDLKLEKSVEPLPADTKASRAVGFGRRAEVPRTGKGIFAPDAEGGRDDPGHPDARTGGHRRVVQHVQRENEDGNPAQHDRIRRRSRGARPGAQQHDRRTAAARHERDPGAAQPRRTGRPNFAICGTRSTGSRRRSRRWRTHRPPSSATWTPSSRPGRAWRPRSNGRPKAVRRRSNRRRTRSRSRRPSSTRALNSCVFCDRARTYCAPLPRRSVTRSPKAR